MDIEKLLRSGKFTKVLIGAGLILSALIIFQAGVFVGIHKAGFSYRMGENFYYRAVGPGGLAREASGEAFSEPNGAAGKIISVKMPSFVVEDPGHGEKTIVVSASTTIRMFREATSSSAITPNDFVIVIGEPNDAGQIQATFIRLLPPPDIQGKPVSN